MAVPLTVQLVPLLMLLNWFCPLSPASSRAAFVISTQGRNRIPFQ